VRDRRDATRCARWNLNKSTNTTRSLLMEEPPNTDIDIPSEDDIRALVERIFGKRPCLWQIRAAMALCRGKDVITCSQTGSGKTLSFWIPLVIAMQKDPGRMVIVVTPLNLLGKQGEADLKKVGISAVAISGKNASNDVLTVCIL
jgi:superfamily II DNA/RNA helicase